MRRWSLLVLVALAAMVTAQCARKPAETADDAWQKARAELEKTSGTEETIAILRGYLEHYPVTDRTVDLLDYLADLEGKEAGRPAETEGLVREILPQITNEDDRFELDKLLVRLIALEGDEGRLSEAVAKVEAARSLTFSDRLDLLQALVDGRAWRLALDQADAALDQTSAEAYRAEHPDTTLSNDEITTITTARKVEVLADRGWALANLGRTDEALADFHGAEPLATTSYPGVPKSPLFRYWGHVELEQGNAKRALELLAPDAVMGGNAEAMADLRRAWETVFPGETGFDEWVWTKRGELARTIEGFTLADYDGREVSLGDFSGKVILLAFWFPT